MNIQDLGEAARHLEARCADLKKKYNLDATRTQIIAKPDALVISIKVFIPDRLRPLGIDSGYTYLALSTAHPDLFRLAIEDAVKSIDRELEKLSSNRDPG